MAVIGAIVGAVGSIAQGAAGAKAARYQAAVARNNQIIANQNADYEIAAGGVEEEQMRMKTGETLSTTKAIQGASGVDVNSGSPLDVRVSETVLGEMDALNIRKNAERRAYAYRAQATGFAADEALYGMQAKNSMLSGFIGAAGSIIGGLRSVSPKWDGMRSGYQPFASYTGGNSFSGGQPSNSNRTLLSQTNNYNSIWGAQV